MIRTIYLIKKNADMTEGRGPMIDTGFAFTEEYEANKYIKGKPGVMGLPDTGYEVVPIKLLDRADEIERAEKSAIRARALLKLTKEEREALGLGDSISD